MGEREAVQNPLAFRRESQQDLAGVVGTWLTRNQAQGFQAIHQSDGAVMLEHQAIRQMADRGYPILRHPFQSQQSLMLLRLNPRIPGSPFAEPKKAPDLKAELF